MKIRLAKKRDIPAILNLLRQVGQVHHQGRPDLFRGGAQKYDESDLVSLLSDPDRPVFVAEEDGKVLGYGFCILQTIQNDPVRTDSKGLYIDDLCVDEAARGCRIGTALYEHIRTYAKAAGCGSVTLNVWAFNENALGFYEKQGLRPQKIVMESILEEE